MTRVAVAPNTWARGFDGVREKVPEAYEVLELREALEREYRTDAHLVTYVVRGAKRQPRINKPGLPHFPQPIEVGVFFADVDNEDHAPWTAEMFADAAARVLRPAAAESRATIARAGKAFGIPRLYGGAPAIADRGSC